MSYLETRAGLDSKRGVVFGGAGGIGRAIATDLSRAGVDLVVCDRDDAGLRDLGEVLADSPGRIEQVHGDVRDLEIVEAAYGHAREAFGGFEILVNVVGGTFRQSFADSGRRGWDALIRANFTWLLESTHQAIPDLRDRGGSVINVTSIEGHRAAPGYAVYAAMKAAVTSLTRTLAVELAPDGIRVNTIAPDIVPTEGTKHLAGSESAHSGLRDASSDERIAGVAIPMGRVGKYTDIGGCALFLASDLSAFVTGTSLHPDGGAIASSGWFNWPDVGWSNVPPPSSIETPDQSHS